MQHILSGKPLNYQAHISGKQLRYRQYILLNY